MILKSINNYLRNNSYNINISNNLLYINNYNRIDNLSNNNIIIIFSDFRLEIKGNNLKLTKTIDKELLFKGDIESINFIYSNE